MFGVFAEETALECRAVESGMGNLIKGIAYGAVAATEEVCRED